jgi:hypothetical protein
VAGFGSLSPIFSVGNFKDTDMNFFASALIVLSFVGFIDVNVIVGPKSRPFTCAHRS